MGNHLENNDEKKDRGRPFDKSLNNIILESAFELIAQVGYDALTIDAIAKKAKVSKTTIYRRWSSKEDIVVEAVLWINPLEKLLEKAAQRDTTQSLRIQLIELLNLSMGEEHGISQQALAAINAAIPFHKQLGERMQVDFYNKFKSVFIATILPYFKPGSKINDEKITLLADLGPALITYRVHLLKNSFDLSYIESIVDDLMIPMLNSVLEEEEEL
ncbi:helix-turn-helix domain containing protein [Schinkia azotoformans]|uniref:TetR/AcrR family transcriptional regulator n=1 Tax=Schinkia azotoformans TaxID=1454 RepID=UPI002E1CBEC9|nr:helix-turn-helix domain containing protein [Schinkia azotoformans]